MTRKRKTSVNTEVLYCGRWDLNPFEYNFVKCSKLGTFIRNADKY